MDPLPLGGGERYKRPSILAIFYPPFEPYFEIYFLKTVMVKHIP